MLADNNLRMKKVLVLIGFNLLCSCSACVMDRRSFFQIKNCTNDTLMIDFSGVDTLRDWKYWNEQLQSIELPIDAKAKMEFYKATIGSIALPDSCMIADPDMFCLYDTCYIYVIKLQVAKSYPMQKIRAEKRYDKRTVTKSDFCDRVFDFR